MKNITNIATLNEEQTNQIIALRKLNKSIAFISAETKIKYPLIKNYLFSIGMFKGSRKWNNVKPEEENTIKDLFFFQILNVTQISEFLNKNKEEIQRTVKKLKKEDRTLCEKREQAILIKKQKTCNTNFTFDEIEQIKKFYYSNYKMKDIADKMNCSYRTIINLIKNGISNGSIERRGNKDNFFFSQEEKEQVKALIEKKFSLREISRKTGRSTTGISYILQSMGIQRNKKTKIHRIPDEEKDKIKELKIKGLKGKDIASSLNRPYSTIYKYIKE